MKANMRITIWQLVVIALILCIGLGRSYQVHAAVGPNQPIGAVSIDSGVVDPDAFVDSSVGTLGGNRWTGSAWTWDEFGTPGGGLTQIGASTGLGTTTYHLGSARWPISFVVDANNSLWEHDYGLTRQANWTWVFLGGGAPDPSLYMGVTNNYVNGTAANTPYVFYVGSDGNLWSNSYVVSNALWTMTQTNYGLLVGSPTGVKKSFGAVAVTINSGEVPYCFVESTDGNLWLLYASGGGFVWVLQGKPPGLFISNPYGSVVISSGTRPFVFMLASDGNLWSRSYSGSTWVWYNHGAPPGVTISKTMGATCANSCTAPYVYVRGSDGNLWEMSWNGSAWVWTNHSKPAGLTINYSVGATSVSNSRPYVFVTASDGKVWLLSWSGSAWAWTNQGQP